MANSQMTSWPRRAVEHGVGVSELHRALLLEVVEDGDGLAPGVAVIAGDGDEDVAHVLLAVGHRAICDDQVARAVALDDERLPDTPGERVLVDGTQRSEAGDVALVVFGVGRRGGREDRERNGRDEPQG